MKNAANLALIKKTARKFFVRRWIGELYVAKRMKMRLLRQVDLASAPSVLEVGCEDGTFSEWFSGCWPRDTVVGLEIDPVRSAASPGAALRLLLPRRRGVSADGASAGNKPSMGHMKLVGNTIACRDRSNGDRDG
jgi:hypothetical protein